MRELIACLLIFIATITGFYYFYPASPKGNTQSGETTTKLENDKAAHRTVNIPQDLNRKPIFEKNTAKRDVTPDSVLPAPNVAGEKLERLPAVIPPPPPPKPPKPEKWQRPIVRAAGIIESGKATIILSDIEPLPLNKKCTDQSGIEWPCGMLARTHMRQFIRGRPIDCSPTKEPKSARRTTRCKLDSFDISAWLVLTGWALPKGNLFEDELKTAKAKQRGQWRKRAP